ncbi:TIGR01621 family pseudouridine synthase [Thalassotalea agarivorans]|nr:TIGR01621 family pseudouridine synthase [Thalassotalea agarivorans]
MHYFDLIAEHPDFIVINKYPDVNFHDESSLGNGLFNQVQKALNDNTLFPVHRLDKMTSGLVLIAKNKESAQNFQQMFEKHLIQKFYLAIAKGKPKKKQGLVKGDMEKARRGSWKLMRTQHNPAITQFFSYGIGNSMRLYLLKPHSGKTHQLRVALNSLSVTILGDERYGGATADRGYLHAYALQFDWKGELQSFVIPPNQGQFFTSDVTQSTLKTISMPWQINWPKIGGTKA